MLSRLKFTMNLTFMKVATGEIAVQFTRKPIRFLQHIQEQSKKAITLAMASRRPEKVDKYAGQITLYDRLEIAKYGKLGCGDPVQFLPRPLGNIDGRAQSGKKSLQLNIESTSLIVCVSHKKSSRLLVRWKFTGLNN